MDATLQLIRYNKRGRISERRTQPARSFVKAFLQLLFVHMAELTENVIDIDNTSRAVLSDSDERTPHLLCTHPGLSSGQSFSPFSTATAVYNIYADDCGIQVGTSATAVAVADDNLVAPIVNGSSAGQFVYYGCWGLNYTTGASSASFDIERIFRNDSGGNITVAEIGVYSINTATGSPSQTQVFGFCILRDVISPTVTVNNGEYLKVKYTVTVSN